MRVGLFFGTFDPLHNGHLAVAGHFLAEEYVDEVWLVPSPQNPLKDASTIAPIEKRIANIQQVLNAVGERRLRVCDIEAKMSTPSYTVRTLRQLGKKFPGATFSLIMGADTATTLHQWREVNKLLNNWDILIYPRRGYQVDKNLLAMCVRMQMVDAPLFEISATQVRQLRAQGKSWRCFVPAGSGERA